MSTITHLLNRTIVVERLQEIAGTDTMAMLTVTASLPCHIQPNADKKTGIAEGVYSKQFVIYLDPTTEIKAGDRIRSADGFEYTAVSDGVTEYSFGSINFMKIICEKTV